MVWLSGLLCPLWFYLRCINLLHWLLVQMFAAETWFALDWNGGGQTQRGKKERSEWWGEWERQGRKESLQGKWMVGMCAQAQWMSCTLSWVEGRGVHRYCVRQQESEWLWLTPETTFHGRKHFGRVSMCQHTTPTPLVPTGCLFWWQIRNIGVLWNKDMSSILSITQYTPSPPKKKKKGKRNIHKIVLL